MLRLFTGTIKTSIKSKKIRNYSSSCDADNIICPGGKKEPKQGLVVGYYSLNDGNHRTAHLTKTGRKYDEVVCGKLISLMQYAGPAPKSGEYRIFTRLEPEFTSVLVAGLGKDCAGYREEEQLDEGKENIRVAAGVAMRQLQPLLLPRVFIESFGHAESAAEGTAMGLWVYQEYKAGIHKQIFPAIDLYDDCDWTGWQIGLQKAAAQNLARQLMECPANAMTPIIFSQTAVEVLCRTGANVDVKVQSWAESHSMGGFCAVGKGSCEPPIFMEVSYYGSDNVRDRPVVLVGQGVTFDSGGVCLKKPNHLRHGRGDLLGAACVVAACRAIAAMQLPINVRGIIPLVEHLPGCSAMKCGDVVITHNGKSVCIQDTRLQARLVLADALSYAQTYWPRFIVDVGSVSRGPYMAMSNTASGVWTNSDKLWHQIRMAAIHTGDRVWRYPLFNHYTYKVGCSSSVDLKSKGREGPGGSCCRAAAFLREFVPCGEWMHMDSWAVGRSKGEVPYMRKGFTGRPTRTLIEFMSQLVCKHDD